jgi:TonB family protein
LGTATTEGEAVSRRQKAYLDRAVAITRAAGSDEAAADLELQIAYQLNSQSGSYRDAMQYIRSALDEYDRLFGPDHPKTAMATLTLGQALIATRDDEEGLINLEKAIEFLQDNPENVFILIRARQLLLSVYMRQGDDAQYDEQLMEIGRLSEGLSTPVEYLPIVKFAPVYPPQAVQRGAGGYVIVEYTVDEEGRTRDLVVVDSGSDGRERVSPETFHAAALASVERYRYIPKFENGVPVSVPGITTRIIFEIGN